MRKTIVKSQAQHSHESIAEWLDLDSIAHVELTSEDPSQPIESALQPVGAPGWRAAEPGPQLIRLLFDAPQDVKRIYLLINEVEVARTQEFVLRYAQHHGRSFREIVRQQFTFAPPGTTTEQEEYRVDLDGVTALELEIMPDVSGSAAKASLGRLLLA
ncbi:hypothetical protein KOM00_15220 [Geomonas sp. Red69]|uniref:Carbohydrate-binding protein n=1 Tax=Geomonas diazotrophica TaxID=2843197 RepID=A0ABX8JIU0_9BACT|nr:MULTISPECIES: hypothetical protein [Geomonas]MBU5638080.1 hypothetical protein [Geomonas diazotrophica]QWV97081.1 hypothetical protein KP005_17295 [Geomonas nitrogeniifigens]QXE86253.1 hypothetical protein KP003_18110 [Geomonas nitrogeniifigens]